MDQLAELEQLGQLVELLRRKTIELLVLQPTPFCNLDCRYCYLPDRANPARMRLDTLATVLDRLAESGHLGDCLSIVWHAGEPMVVPPAWYEAAFALCRKHLPARVGVRHCFQTNAVLIDDGWCDLIRTAPVHLGVSLDGPAFLHDRMRLTRKGEGTHARVMQGIGRLRAASIPFHVICVLGRPSLDHADAIYDFFAALEPAMLCFNIEEIEAANQTSSLQAGDVEAAWSTFLDRILERQRTAGQRLRIREIERVLARLRDPHYPAITANAQATPLAIVSVDHRGHAGTFSPELLGWNDPRLGAMAFADLTREPLEAMFGHPGFRRIEAEIEDGVAACRQACPYFAFCGGGAPANKLAEHARLDGTETLFCRITEMVLCDRILLALERELAVGCER